MLSQLLDAFYIFSYLKLILCDKDSHIYYPYQLVVILFFMFIIMYKMDKRISLFVLSRKDIHEYV